MSLNLNYLILYHSFHNSFFKFPETLDNIPYFSRYANQKKLYTFTEALLATEVLLFYLKSDKTTHNGHWQTI